MVNDDDDGGDDDNDEEEEEDGDVDDVCDTTLPTPVPTLGGWPCLVTGGAADARTARPMSAILGTYTPSVYASSTLSGFRSQCT